MAKSGEDMAKYYDSPEFQKKQMEYIEKDSAGTAKHYIMVNGIRLPVGVPFGHIPKTPYKVKLDKLPKPPKVKGPKSVPPSPPALPATPKKSRPENSPDGLPV